MRVNVNLDEDLVKEMDIRADKLHVSRSAYISMCVTRQMQMDDMSDNLPKIVQFVDKVKDVDFRRLEKISKSKK